MTESKQSLESILEAMSGIDRLNPPLSSLSRVEPERAPAEVRPSLAFGSEAFNATTCRSSS